MVLMVTLMGVAVVVLVCLCCSYWADADYQSRCAGAWKSMYDSDRKFVASAQKASFNKVSKDDYLKL